MRLSTSFSAALLLTCFGGCAQLHKDLVRFDRSADCPKETATGLAARRNELGPLSPTRDLQCALVFLRKTDDPALLRTPLGSRLALHLAERESDPGRREKLAAEGVRFAEKAVALGAGNDGVVHYYLAANLGLAVRDQMALAVQNLPRLEGEMKRAVALSPDVDDGGPLRLLGMLYLKAPPWPTGIGDGDKALDLLKRALDKHPGHPLNHLFYAQALWEVEGDEAVHQVRARLETGMNLLRDGRWGYSKEPWRREFAELQKEVDELGEARRSASPVAFSAGKPLSR